MQRKKVIRFLLTLPTNIIRNTEADLQIGLGLSGFVRAGLCLTLIKTSGLFWAGYDTCK